MIYDNALLETVDKKYLFSGDSEYMKATDIHSVSCDNKYVTAWFVFEGRENKMYNNVAYSSNELNDLDTNGLYIKPSKSDILHLLKLVELID